MSPTAGATAREIIDLIVSLNIARRHLNPGQRAMVALEYEKAIADATPRGDPVGNRNAAKTSPGVDSKVRDPAPLKSRDRAAKAVGASADGVQRAKAVQRDAPDLAEKVRNGQMA